MIRSVGKNSHDRSYIRDRIVERVRQPTSAGKTQLSHELIEKDFLTKGVFY